MTGQIEICDGKLPVCKGEPKQEFDISRRIDMQRHTPAEKAIRDAIDVVEGVGADTLLTEAVCLLAQAQNLVADYVEREGCDASYTCKRDVALGGKPVEVDGEFANVLQELNELGLKTTHHCAGHKDDDVVGSQGSDSYIAFALSNCDVWVRNLAGKVGFTIRWNSFGRKLYGGEDNAK